MGRDGEEGPGLPGLSAQKTYGGLWVPADRERKRETKPSKAGLRHRIPSWNLAFRLHWVAKNCSAQEFALLQLDGTDIRWRLDQ